MKKHRQLLDIPTWDNLHAHPCDVQSFMIAIPDDTAYRLHQQRYWIKTLGKPVDWLRGMGGESVTRYIESVLFDMDTITIILSPEI